ncbi:CCR4-not complex 3'-5'-exoribonuclease subunit CCR4 (CCR4) [Vairimorpha necatrix]|uniref:poly(A)-specific ribonuclease n=1 Tax=Vairimorpha necatrix TaxID=6039 RepID=A0AAX4J8Q7_9MICR
MEDLQNSKKKNLKTVPKNYLENYLGLDFSFQGIKHLSNSLFQLIFLKELNLRGNELENIPSDIFILKNLEILNLSKNKIKFLPPKMGKMVNLKEIYLSDNLISNIPMELGCLYNCTVFEINNNPLISPFNILYKEKKLLQYCREHNSNYSPPVDRTWLDTVIKKDENYSAFSCGTFNILSNYSALKLGYPPTWILNPEYRKENILHNICSYNVDILCLQEIEIYNYQDFYKDQLDLRCEYDSTFFPKGRSKNIPDSKNVDGCATFWKKGKFRHIESLVIDFYSKLLHDNKFVKNVNLMTRYGKKDNIATVTLLECLETKKILIVVNVHLYWDPEYEDIKFVQTLLLIDELEKISKKFKDAGILLLGDFNSLYDSNVYSFITNKDFETNAFGFPVKNSLNLFDAYCNEETNFTNFTPTFKGVIDYIFYNDKLELKSILSNIESEYCDRVVGLPNIHFPSDHVFIASKFIIKKK